jgi:serine/threonine protein kinase
MGNEIINNNDNIKNYVYKSKIIIEIFFNFLFNKLNIVNKNNFFFQYVIGKGGFGKVWKVTFKRNKKLYALKVMNKVKIIDKKSQKNIKTERKILSYLKHSFIVNMVCAFQDFENLYLVMDLLLGGDLRYHLCNNVSFSEIQISKIKYLIKI